MPDWHASTAVQRLPSLQAVASGALGLLHRPVAGAQTPATWHWSSATHVLAAPPVHTPARQESESVQPFLSSQRTPSATTGFEQAPVAALQTPAIWHGS